MKTVIRYWVGLSVLFAITAIAAPVLPIERWNTTAGVPVLFVPSHQVPMLDVRVVFNAGSAQDGAAFGIADLTANVLNQGAAEWSADQIAQQWSEVGALYNASVTRDMAIIDLMSLTAPDQLKPALVLFHQVLVQPSFPQESVAWLKQQQLMNIQLAAQDPGEVAGKALYQALYGNMPYGHPVAGRSDSVSALNRAQLQAFYQRYYVAHNAMIVMVGDVSEAQAHQIAEQLVEGLPAGNAVTPLPTTLTSPVSQTVNIDFPTQQTSLLFAQIATRAGDPRNYALMVGNEILGGDGLTSRFYQQVRAQAGLAYGIGSGFSKGMMPGPFVIQVKTRNDQANQVIAKVEAVLQQFLQQGPTPAEVAAAQQRLIGQFPLGFASNQQIASILTYMGFYHLPLDYLDQYRQKIAAVTPQQIQQTFNQVVQVNHLALIRVGGHGE